MAIDFKRLTAGALVLAVLAVCVGCSGGPDSTPSAPAGPSPTTAPLKGGKQAGAHGMDPSSLTVPGGSAPTLGSKAPAGGN